MHGRAESRYQMTEPQSTGNHHLDRFLQAQRSVYEDALSELRAGRKESHWIWFIFPQIAGLGHSPAAQFYAIESLQEAVAYLQHPVLGSRLRECTGIVNDIEGRSINAIFGSPDDMKFRSSMSLFAQATKDNQIFLSALKKYFDGKPDQLTLQKLGL
jgi:uncharacterized protein (DUF1810 family)